MMCILSRARLQEVDSALASSCGKDPFWREGLHRENGTLNKLFLLLVSTHCYVGLGFYLCLTHASLNAQIGDSLTRTSPPLRGMIHSLMPAVHGTVRYVLNYIGKHPSDSMFCVAASTSSPDGRPGTRSCRTFYMSSARCFHDESTPQYKLYTNITSDWRGTLRIC